MQNQIFDLLLKEDDISWQVIIKDLIKQEKMNPWDINVTVLTQKYIEILKQLKELDFNLSGKIVLAAAILLKIKSNRLIGEDILNLDLLFQEKDEDEFMDDDDYIDYLDNVNGEDYSEMKLIPKTPQPRQRKVSIYDLMNALEKAMDVKKRHLMRTMPDDKELRLPIKKFDVSLVIRELYISIKTFFRKNNKLTFSMLLPSNTKQDKVYTFIPLLHLTNQRKIDLSQEEHFGEIDISLRKKE